MPQSNLDFAGRSGAALIVGGGGGLGSAIAHMLAERGSDIALTYRSSSEAALAAVGGARFCGRRAQAWQLDLTDAPASATVVGEVVATFENIHTLVYAAGPHVPMVHLSRVPPEQFRSHIENDAVAFFNVVQPVIPHLRTVGGSIVAVTTAALRRFPVRDGLSAGPKGAVEALARGLAVEEGRFGVRVNCVGPGMLTDGMADRLISSGELDDRALAVARQNIPLKRFGTAKDIAELVCFLASDRANFISGQAIDVDGGYGA
jgi:NAD(P)-dependent dehydrogenase (short-subunit alcohol dehydrogenase family)